ncbi:MAG: HD domain-containing protein [Candidatus Aminicenantes bacterium]|nr:HD domain-containing protein [Candidatus Aminicenantes bacterium]
MKKIKSDFPHKTFFVEHFGENIFAVGGYIRDKLLDPSSKSGMVDLIITGVPAEKIIETLKIFGKVNLVGKSFGVIKFVIDHQTYDIALPRKDFPKNKKKRGHKDFIIQADPEIPLKQDLKRRDFRCNSMALRLSDDTLIDHFNGVQDVKDKVLRLTNPDSFPDDPLRVLRAARFASTLDFKVDPRIYKVSKHIDLTGLSVERITEELFQILLNSPSPSKGLDELFKLDALRQLFPSLYTLTLSIQDSLFHPEKDTYGHHTVWKHTTITVDQAKRLAEIRNIQAQRKLVLLLAALFHDIGKPETAQWEYKKGRMVITNNRHDIRGEKEVKKILNQYKIHTREGYDLKNTVLRMIRCHHRASELWQNREVITKKAFNRLAADVDGEIELLIVLDAADRAGRNETPVQGLDKQGHWLLNQFKELNVSRETIKPLIMGRDLIKLGVKPGPKMGRILKKLYQLQLDDEFRTKKQGLKHAQQMIKKEGS